MCPNNKGMTDTVRKTMLDLHNSYRSSLARGLERDGLGGNAPKAKYMHKMNYDCEVEASAMKNAKSCVYHHTDWSERVGLGENIGALSWLNYDKNKAAAEVSGHLLYFPSSFSVQILM
ncbi:SCP-like protein [Oesophagostomum dentatum]|uniref:SCP-like protein n=1 Tax=Oesophagostomum dentatum TaxID=61180 RepID=A0A0B1S8X3_OESDE|nr:SCP-like protein [Oesophagostomum dentatum]